MKLEATLATQTQFVEEPLNFGCASASTGVIFTSFIQGFYYMNETPIDILPAVSYGFGLGVILTTGLYLLNQVPQVVLSRKYWSTQLENAEIAVNPYQTPDSFFTENHSHKPL